MIAFEEFFEPFEPPSPIEVQHILCVASWFHLGNLQWRPILVHCSEHEVELVACFLEPSGWVFDLSVTS